MRAASWEFGLAGFTKVGENWEEEEEEEDMVWSEGGGALTM